MDAIFMMPSQLIENGTIKFLDTQVSLAPTPVRPSVRKSVRHTFGFPFCQHLWDLTKRPDDIVVANMVANMEVNKVANMEVDKVTDKVADMVADNKKLNRH